MNQPSKIQNDEEEQTFEIITIKNIDQKDDQRKVSPHEAPLVRKLQEMASQSSLSFNFSVYYFFRDYDPSSYRGIDPEFLRRMSREQPYSIYSIHLSYSIDFYTDMSVLPPDPLTELSLEMATLPHLYELELTGIPLLSLKHLPPVKVLRITYANLDSLIDAPPTISAVEELRIEFWQNLKSLEGLPKVMLHLKDFLIRGCSDLMTLSHLPEMPNLKSFKCENTSIRNFAGISSIVNYLRRNKGSMSFQNNHIISPHGKPLPREEKSFLSYFKDIKRFLEKVPNEFPSSYFPYLNLINYTWQEIHKIFQPDPMSLAVKYINGNNLSQFEYDRIWAEGTMNTVRLLVQHLPPTDLILQKLADRWDFSLDWEYGLVDHDAIEKGTCVICHKSLPKTELTPCQISFSRNQTISPYSYCKIRCYNPEFASKKLGNATVPRSEILLCSRCKRKCDVCNQIYCGGIVQACDCGHDACPSHYHWDNLRDDAYCSFCLRDR